jgi:hypothetical protein
MKVHTVHLAGLSTGRTVYASNLLFLKTTLKEKNVILTQYKARNSCFCKILIFTAVTIKHPVYRNVTTLFSSCNNKCFGGIYNLLL